MISLLTHFGEEASGPAALGINAQAFVVQLFTFLIAFLILRRFAFKPILKLLDERRQTIENGILLGEKMQAEKAKLEEDVAKTLRSARQSADDIMSSAQATAKQTVAAAEETARERAAAMLKEAEASIAAATKRERKRLE